MEKITTSNSNKDDLIDVSLEDDCLISNAGEGNEDYFEMCCEDVPSKASTTAVAAKCNLRKSLAWDAAFFTGAGVLDPQELSLINPGLHTSTTTLFHNNSSFSASNKTDRAPPAKTTSNTHTPATTKKESQIIINKEPHKTKWELPKPATLRPPTLQAAAKSGELNTSTLRPPKIAGRNKPISTSPTKRTSLGANRVKIEYNTVKFAAGRRETVGGSKRPVSSVRTIIPSSTPSLKSSSSSSVSTTKVDSAASCSSHNRSGSSTSSESTDKSPFDSLRKKINSRNVGLPSASTLNPLLRTSLKNKSETGNSFPSSSISPASSQDGWSSESSSSTSVNQHSNSSVKIVAISSPRKGFYLERGASQSNMQNQQSQRSVEQKRAGLPGQCSKKNVSVACSLTRPAATDVSRSSKPSGLRMPSPKIGFFDAEKSTESTSTGSLKFHPGVRSAIPKHGAGVGSLHGGIIRAKPGKLQSVRSMTGISSMHIGSHPHGESHCASSSMRPDPIRTQELSIASPKISATKTTKIDCSSITSTPQRDDRTFRGSNFLTGKSGEVNNKNSSSASSWNEGKNGGHDASVNDMDTRSEQVSASRVIGRSSIICDSHLDRAPPCVSNVGPTFPTQAEELSNASANVKATTGNCPNITSTPKNDVRTGTETPLIIREVGEMNYIDIKSSSSFANEAENGSQYAFVNDIDTRNKQESVMIMAGKSCLRCDSDLTEVTHFSSTPQIDDRTQRVGHLMTGGVGEMTHTISLESSLSEGVNAGQDTFVNAKDRTIEQVFTTKALGDYCSGLTSKLQNAMYHRIDTENHLKNREVGDLTTTERKCASLFLTEGKNDGQESFGHNIGRVSENVAATEATSESQGITLEQGLYQRTYIESHLKTEDVRELMKIESGSLFSKEGENLCRNAIVNYTCSLGDDSLIIPSIMTTSGKALIRNSCKPSLDSNHDNKVAFREVGDHFLGHHGSNLSLCHDNIEKENTLYFGNQVDGLSRHLGSKNPNMEVLTGNNSSLSQFDGNAGSPDDAKFLRSNSGGVLVYAQDEFPKVTNLSPSPNSIDLLPGTRSPLALKVSLCSESGASEFSSESTMENVSTSSMTDDAPKEIS